MAQIVKNLPAVRETQVQSLSWEDALEKGMATHSSLLAWEIPWTEEPGGLHSWGHKVSDTTEQANNSNSKGVIRLTLILPTHINYEYSLTSIKIYPF